MASFSRLQLAAALLEYDNDPNNPTASKKSAYESAIFAHLRNANGNIHAKKAEAQQSNDYLGVSLPSEAGGPSESLRPNKDLTRRSKASIDMLHNPFGGEDEEEEQDPEDEEQDLEVDLASWGLDSLIPEKKESKSTKGKGKTKLEVLPSKGRATSTLGMSHSRSASMPLAELGESNSVFDERFDFRRNSISNPLDLADQRPRDKTPVRQRTTSFDGLSARPPLQSTTSYDRKRDTIPFPSSNSIPERSEANDSSNSRPASRIDVLSDGAQANDANPFAIPPPPPSRASRFDPKTMAHQRTLSNATRLSMGPHDGIAPRAPSRASALDVKSTRERRQSTATMRTRDMLDDDYQSAYGYDDQEYSARERRYSRLDLMRPKVLVMPSPLQGATPAPTISTKPTREGFLDSSDGRPLPPGARASRMSTLGTGSSLTLPVPSNSFIPNPRLSLSASQLLFRNSLMVDGQRDVTYNDIDGNIERALEEGEQVEIPEPKEETPKAKPEPLPPQDMEPMRPAGKLFGRSLIDDLDKRKAEIRGKKRVFTGDQRPSMMDRPGMKRSSTFIDPSSLGERPPLGARIDSSQTDTSLVRRGSRSSKPLLAMDDSGKIAETGIRESRLAHTRSVFGVDTLWATEMEKLEVIEAEEKANAEERKRREEEEAKKAKKKGKSKGKKKNERNKLEVEQAKMSEQSSPITLDTSPTQPANEFTLTLPDIPVVTSRKRVARPPVDDGSDSESSASEAAPAGTPGTALVDEAVDQWVSDEEKRPAPRVSARAGYLPNPITTADDSDEDLPLSMALEKVTRKLSLHRGELDDDSDEDKPLSTLLLDRPKVDIPQIDFDNLNSSYAPYSGGKADDEEEDDIPLGIRASRLPGGASQLSRLSSLSVGGNEDDDDRPLSMHPGQVRKSQFQMFAQMQQQQQQMLQAQMANSMAFAAPPSMMFMMPPAAPFASQPHLPVQENKFNSVDRWRHGVAVEGSTN